MILKKLCEADGVSGNEGRIREIIIDEIKPYADKITVDIMGNLIAFKKGKNSDKKIMLCAHMDEVGFIVSEITQSGYLKFQTVGGIDARVLIGKRVRICKNGLSGVIALKAVHLQSKAERENAPKEKDLYIDIGAKSKEDAEKYVSLGDYAAFDTEFDDFGNGFYKGKAFDDRCGCAIMTEAIRRECCFDTYFCFTVQEECGCRGAQICANRIGADAAMVLEATTCADVSGVPAHLEVTTQKGGAAISLLDRGSCSDAELTKRLVELCGRENVCVQYKRTTMGGNDARAIQTAVGGTLTCAVSVPCRYLHSPVGVVSEIDYEAAGKVAELFVTKAKELI